jgi:hypothetical protein
MRAYSRAPPAFFMIVSTGEAQATIAANLDTINHAISLQGE